MPDVPGFGRPLLARALRTTVLEEIRTGVPCDAYAWLLTDPETCAGSSPLAEIPSLADLPPPHPAEVPHDDEPLDKPAIGRVSVIVRGDGGQPVPEPDVAELRYGYGVTDVASTLFRDPHWCWGFPVQTTADYSSHAPRVRGRRVSSRPSTSRVQAARLGPRRPAPTAWLAMPADRHGPITRGP